MVKLEITLNSLEYFPSIIDDFLSLRNQKSFSQILYSLAVFYLVSFNKKIDSLKLEFLTKSIQLQKKIYTYMSASFGNRHLLILVSYFLGF